ncbi:MAG: LacI family DNA-binding transcriptional regulator [Sphaerochaeta sp.]|jgi:LacI family transcriptional regulator
MAVKSSREKRVTIKDVAALADVSMSTVSLILKDEQNNRFPEATRKRVLDAVKELQYQPAVYAQQMRGKHLQVIGLIIPDLANHYYPEVTSGFTKQANELGYNVILLNSNNSISQEQSFGEALIAMRVAGVAICGVYTIDEREKELIKRLQSQGIPVVRFDRYEEDDISPYVGIDNYRAGYTLTEKLIHAGHRKIACIVPKEPVHIVAERRRGYLEAMQKYQLNPTICGFKNGDVESIHVKLSDLWSSGTRPTAIFTPGGDMDAIECIKSADALGIEIPQDLSVAGFDDIYVASLIKPALTTVRQPKYEIGTRAMALLYKLIQKEEVVNDRILLPVECIQRDSTRMLIENFDL